MADSDDKALGELAVELGLISPGQLAESIEVRKAMAAMGVSQTLGEVMLAKGFLTRESLKDLIREERKRSGRAVRIGNYEVLAKLGEGGMGAVYKARIGATGAVVALKVLPPKLAMDRTFVERFKREAELASRLDHPNIVRAIEASEANGVYYFVMEYVEGESVGSRLKRSGSIPEREALDVVRQIALALDHAHGVGLVHRDVKPDNIFVTPDGVAKLGDMGLARFAGDEEITRLTQTGMMVGTPHYVSPEQASGSRDIDTRSDIYSLGATLYHMIAGKVPFEGTTALAVMNKHMNEPLPWPAELRAAVSDGARALITKMMAKDRAERYQTPEELIRDLLPVMAGETPPSVARKSTRTAAPSARPPSRESVRLRRSTASAVSAAKKVSPALWAALAMGGAFVLTAVAVLVMGGGGGNAPPAQLPVPPPKRPPAVPTGPLRVPTPERPTPEVVQPVNSPVQPMRTPSVAPQPTPASLPSAESAPILLVDFGPSAEKNVYGAGWTSVELDQYSKYTDAGPGGTKGTDTAAYNFQRIDGKEVYYFWPGDRVLVTWFNASPQPVEIEPYLSFNDPDRRLMQKTGTWYEMSKATIPPGASGTTSLLLTDEMACMSKFLNVASDFSVGELRGPLLVCDKIEICRVSCKPGTGKVLYSVGFDDGDLRGWQGGEIVDVHGRGKALSATKKRTQWSCFGLQSDWRPSIPLTRNAWLSFWYYLEKPAPTMLMHMKNTNEAHNGFQLKMTGKYALKAGEWSFFSIPLAEFVPGQATFTDGDLGRQLTLEANEPELITFMIDSVMVTRGPPEAPAALPQPPAQPRSGAASFGDAKIADLGGGRREIVWEFDKPLDPSAWHLFNVLPENSRGGAVVMDRDNPRCFHRDMVPRVLFDGDIEVEAVFTGLDGLRAEGKRPPSPSLGICAAAASADGKRRMVRLSCPEGTADERWLPIEVTDKRWPTEYPDNMPSMVLKLARRGAEVEFSFSAAADGSRMQKVGTLAFQTGPVGVDAGLFHAWCSRLTGRLEKLRIVGTPVGRLDLPELGMSVPRKPSAVEQWAYALAEAKEHGISSPEAHDAYAAQVLHYPRDIEQLGGEKALFSLMQWGAPGTAVELWESVKGNFSQRDAVEKDCLLRIGEARSALGDKPGALACLLPGREFSGPYAHAIGDACLKAGDTDEAIAAYRFCLDKYPAYWNRSKVLLGLAECLRTKGRPDEALAALREVIEKCVAYPADCDKARKAIAEIEAELKAKRR